MSLSLWRDEKSLIRWRVHGGHHAAQVRGRADILADYRLRVGEVIAHSSHDIGSGRSRLDTTEIGAAKAVILADGVETDKTLAPLAAHLGAVDDRDTLDAITEPGREISLHGFASEESAHAALPAPRDGQRVLAIRIVRDYGMRERREAVQWMI